MKRLFLSVAILLALGATAQQAPRQGGNNATKFTIDSISITGVEFNTLVINTPTFNGNVASVNYSLMYVGTVRQQSYAQLSYKDVVTIPDTASVKYAVNTIAVILANKRGLTIIH